MPRAILLIMCLIGWAQNICFAETPPHRAPHVTWVEGLTWPAVIVRAQKTQTPILVDFYATWCGPCKALDAMVYNEAAVIRELEDVLTFKVDVDKPQYDDLEKQFGIKRLPTLVWCGPDGTPWFRFTGYVTSDTFLTRVRGWKRSMKEERELLNHLAESPHDPEVLLAAYRRRAREGRMEEAAQYRMTLLALTSDTRRGGATQALLSIARGEWGAGETINARMLGRQIETMFPQQGLDLDREVRRCDLDKLELLAKFQSQITDTLGALETYSHMIKLDRGSMVALENFTRMALAARIRLPQATTCALRAVIRSGNRPDLVSLLAECYDRRNFHLRAVHWMEKAVEQDPDNGSYQQALKKYRQACPSWLLPLPGKKNHKAKYG